METDRYCGPVNISESSIERAVCDYARDQGCIVMKLAGANQKGQPDRMFLHNERVLFIEFKAPSGKPTPLQLKWLKKLRKQGFPATTCDDKDKGIDLINHIFF